jgi:hypothetical protein
MNMVPISPKIKEFQLTVYQSNKQKHEFGIGKKTMGEKMLRKALIKTVGRYPYLFNEGCGPGSVLKSKFRS